MVIRFCSHCGWLINSCFSYYGVPVTNNKRRFYHERCYKIINKS